MLRLCLHLRLSAATKRPARPQVRGVSSKGGLQFPTAGRRSSSNTGCDRGSNRQKQAETPDYSVPPLQPNGCPGPAPSQSPPRGRSVSSWLQNGPNESSASIDSKFCHSAPSPPNIGGSFILPRRFPIKLP